MCTPALAVPLLIASTAVSAGAAVYGGIQQNKAYRAQAAVDEQNAGLAIRQANDARERGGKAEVEHYRRLSQLRGQQVAALAANGVDVSFGSALDTQVDTAILGAGDADVIRENTMREVEGYDINAYNYRARAAASRTAGKNALTSGHIGAGTTLLTGASQVAGASSMYAGGGKLSRAAAGLSVRNPALDTGFASAKYAKI